MQPFCIALATLAMSLAVAPAAAQGTAKIDAGAAGGSGSDWASFVPPTDGTFSTFGETAPDIGLVKRMFHLMYAEECSWSLGGATAGEDPDVYDLSYRYGYETEADAEHQLKLYRFFCNSGAYNEVHVYLTWDASWGLRPVSFAQPSLDIRYENEDALEGAVMGISIDGYSATQTLVNSDFDPAAGAIISWSHWRGLGDASSSGTYSFREGSFVLTRYIADPSYDGEINPLVILDLTAPTSLELVPAEVD